MYIERARAERTAADKLQEYGIGEQDAVLTAEVLVAADACGTHSHGLLRLPRIVRGIEHGNVDPEGEIRIVNEGVAVATIDGGARLGPVVALRAIVEAEQRADECGIGAVGVRNSNHLGMLGYYTNETRKAGYVGFGMTNTEPAMPPFGGAEAILGTNPIAIGLPTDPPFNLDMSTSSVARGKILQAKEADEEIPNEIALGSDGEPTDDPEAALEGTILPFGGPKGSGLAIAVEILAGGLVGAAMGRDVTGTYHTRDSCTKGDLFIVLDPETFNTNFEAAANSFLVELLQSRRAPSFDDIRLPGERSADQMADVTTITIDDDLWAKIKSLTD